jgi:hypothetical protein
VSSLQAEEPVFSGPQIGEKLPELKSLGLFGEQEGKSLDLISGTSDGPVLVVFFHQLTRPAFGLMRAITKFAAEREDPRIQTGVVFLTDDLTQTVQWAGNVRRLLPDQVTYAVSPDGQEGPGAYGLNRNVTLTILVGKEGKVTANFALVQPQLQADGPKILRAIADVTGGGTIPDIESLDPRYALRMSAQEGRGRPNMAGRQGSGRGANDPELTALLRAVINKQADESQVREAAAKVEAYVTEQPSAGRELARIVTTIIDAGKIENYGTETAQSILRQWRDKYGRQPAARDSTPQPKSDQDEE